MFYSGWHLGGPTAFDITSTTDNGHPIAIAENPKASGSYNHVGDQQREGRQPPPQIIRFLSESGPLEDDRVPSPNHPLRFSKISMATAAHLRSNAPLVPQSGIAYVECHILEVVKSSRSAATEASNSNSTIVPLVIGVCRDTLPTHRLPGEELHSVGFFLSQRTVFRHGRHEGERLVLPLSSSRDSAFMACNGQAMTRRGGQSGDSVGCLVNFLDGAVRFTLNGHLLPGSSAIDPNEGTTHPPVGSDSALNGYYLTVGVQRRQVTVVLECRFYTSTGPLTPPPPMWRHLRPPLPFEALPPSASKPYHHHHHSITNGSGGTHCPRHHSGSNGGACHGGNDCLHNSARVSMDAAALERGGGGGTSFDVAAYSHRLVSERLHREHPRLYDEDTCWAEAGLNEVAVGTLLRQFATARGMTQTLQALDRELDARQRLRCGAPTNDPQNEEGQEARHPTAPDTAASSCGTDATSESTGGRANAGSSLLTSPLPRQLLLIQAQQKARDAMYTYSTHLGDARRLILEAGHPSNRGSSLAQFFLLRYILSPTVRATVATALHLPFSALDKAISPQFWMLWFFARRQDVLYALKALQAVEHTIGTIMSTLDRIAERIDTSTGVTKDSTAGRRAATFSTRSHPTTMRPGYVEASIMAAFTATVLEPFANVQKFHLSSRKQMASQLAELRRASSMLSSEPHDDAEDARGDISSPGAKEDYWDAFQLYAAHCRAVPSASSGMDATSSSSSSPPQRTNPMIEGALTALALGALPSVTAPPRTSQFMLGQTLVILVTHFHVFFAEYDHDSSRRSSWTTSDSGDSTPSVPTSPPLPERRAAKGLASEALSQRRPWVGLWRRLLSAALAQYRRRVWSNFQGAVEDVSERVCRRLVGWMQTEDRRRRRMALRHRDDTPPSDAGDDPFEGQTTASNSFSFDPRPEGNNFDDELAEHSGSTSGDSQSEDEAQHPRRNDGQSRHRSTPPLYVTLSILQSQSGYGEDEEQPEEEDSVSTSGSETASRLPLGHPFPSEEPDQDEEEEGGVTGRHPSARNPTPATNAPDTVPSDSEGRCLHRKMNSENCCFTALYGQSPLPPAALRRALQRFGTNATPGDTAGGTHRAELPEGGRREDERDVQNNEQLLMEQLFLLNPPGRPTLRSIYRRVHAAAVLEPRALLFTNSFLDSLTASVRGLPPVSGFMTEHRNAHLSSSSTAGGAENKGNDSSVNSPTHHHLCSNPQSPHSKYEGIWKRPATNAGADADTTDGGRLEEDFSLASVYLKRVFTLMFDA